MRIYGYLRASTIDQDANRAKSTLLEFAEKQQLKVSAWFTENESGAKLERPELFRLLETAEPGDGILIEQIDRITRLSEKDWEKLKSIILENQLKVISLDLPTSHNFIHSEDEFQRRILTAVNAMMLDILAATARKDYLDRRRRQAEGVQKAKAEGKYRGRPVDKELHSKIRTLINDGKSYNFIQGILGCSRHTISKVNKELLDDIGMKITSSKSMLMFKNKFTMEMYQLCWREKDKRILKLSVGRIKKTYREIKDMELLKDKLDTAKKEMREHSEIYFDYKFEDVDDEQFVVIHIKMKDIHDLNFN